MNFYIYSIKSIIYNIYNFISLHFILFSIILSEININNEIKNNFLEISLISSGNIIYLDNLICSYDANFSYQISKKKGENLKDKYILCLYKPDKKLYLLNSNNINTLDFLFELSYLPNDDISMNLYADENNNSICLISFFITKFFIYKYNILPSDDVSSNKIADFEYNINDLVDGGFKSFGCQISDLKNEYLTCCILYSQKIHCLDFLIKDEIKYNDSNSYELSNYSFENKRTLSTNKNEETIFLCYKINVDQIYCFFYNIRNNTFLIKGGISECTDNIKSYYFDETKQFILTCRKENKGIYIYSLNDNALEKDFNNSLIEKEYNYIRNYFISYNSFNQEYNLIVEDNNNTFKYLYNKSQPNIANNDEKSSDKSTTNLNMHHIIYLTEKKSLSELLSNLDDVLKDKEIGQNYEIKNPDYILSIRPLNSITLPSATHLNLSECISILKEKKIIDSSSELTLFQLEIISPNNQTLVNKVEYKILDKNLKEIDLSVCEDLNIQVVYGIKKTAEIKFDQISSYQDLGINVFNLSESFFNDICHIYPNFEKDIILEDRIQNIFLNYSVCEEGCTYKYFDIDYYTFTCECKFKSSIITEFSEIKFESSNVKTNNFEVLKCFNLVFSYKDKTNNIGFWIFTFSLGGHVPLLFHFISTGINPIKDYILNEMKENGYLKDEKDNENNSSKSNNNKEDKNGKKNKKKNKVNNIKKYKKYNNNEQIENDINNNAASPPLRKGKKKSSVINMKGKKKKIKTHRFQVNNNLNLEKVESPERFGTDKIKRKKLSKKALLILNEQTDKNTEEGENKNESYKINKNKIRSNNKIRKSRKITSIPRRINSNITTNSNSRMKNANKSISDNNFIDIKDFDFQFSEDEENETNDKVGFKLININLNIKRKGKIMPCESNKILNNYSWEEAIEYDQRPIIKIFNIFLISKQVLFHTFFYKSPLELLSIRALILIFILSNFLFFNSFFYFNDNISKKYRYTKGLFYFTFTNNIFIIILAILVNFIILPLITKLGNSTYIIRDIFKKEEEKMKKDKNYIVTEKRKIEILRSIEEIMDNLKKKIIILFVIEFIIMLFYWYFVTAFCHVYTNTQISWILDSFLSIIFSFIIECLFYILFSKLYRIAIESNICSLYKFVIFFYNFV